MKKSKKLLSVIISLCMIVSCMTGISFPAAAAYAVTHNPHTGSCVHSRWTEWSSKSSIPVDPGNYYLTSDIDYLWIVPAGITNLCLNGHSIYGTIYLSSYDSVLNLYDESGNSGRIMHKGIDDSPGIKIEYGQLNMYGGTITQNNHSSYGGGVYVERGTFNMYGGVIARNNSSISDCNNVYVSSFSSFTHYDGTIDGGFYSDDKYSIVSFDKNGGSGVTSQQYVKANKETQLKANNFTPPKHKVFKGWSTSADGQIIKSITTLENVTLYAIWEDAPTYDSLLQIVWDDNNNIDGLRTDTITATINNQSFRITEEDSWCANATGLYEEDNDKWAIMAPNGYTSTYTTDDHITTITLIHTVENSAESDQTSEPEKTEVKSEATVKLSKSKATIKLGKETKINISKLVKVSNLSKDQKAVIKFNIPNELKNSIKNGVLKISGNQKGSYTIKIIVNIKSKTGGEVVQTITKSFKIIIK